ncbi:uncharacterized protein [Aegilops tauschii subsp. strangulata]|uniref:uncharacterized protein n=1 Tax=Aegilops tauschii subsp. strangulata TaxID=200361 RepID=UPI00098AD8F5|nr:uncharacterized protein LOC109731502 [Aegilops tauschii subsp. strangulata]
MIARLDAAQDLRHLSAPETWLCRKLKAAYLGLSSLDRSIARQRTRFSWLKNGEASSAFLRIHASHRKQQNHIFSLQVEDNTISDPDAMASAAFEHFSRILGTVDARTTSINLQEVHQSAFDLSALDNPFSEEEIWDDFCAAFDKLYLLNGRGFQKLNKAFITLLPKRPDASTLNDFWPINLSHLFAKLFAKVLSLRLAPKLCMMVSTNQSAFIAGRCIHDNFLLVQQTARLLHNLKMPRLLLKLEIARAFDSVSWAFLLDTLSHLGFRRR